MPAFYKAGMKRARSKHWSRNKLRLFSSALGFFKAGVLAVDFGADPKTLTSILGFRRSGVEALRYEDSSSVFKPPIASAFLPATA